MSSRGNYQRSYFCTILSSSFLMTFRAKLRSLRSGMSLILSMDGFHVEGIQDILTSHMKFIFENLSWNLWFQEVGALCN